MRAECDVAHGGRDVSRWVRQTEHVEVISEAVKVVLSAAPAKGWEATSKRAVDVQEIRLEKVVKEEAPT
jgi:hypothetical protein